MKKIKQAEEEDRKQSAKDNLNRLELSFCQQPFSLSFISPGISTTAEIRFPAYHYHYSNRYTETIFRPPKQVG